VDWSSVDPIELADGPDATIDQYLRECKQRKVLAAAPAAVGVASPIAGEGRDLRLKLARLKRMVN
jgi:hypothetical protein